jgi:hypothetical protein
MKGAENVGLYRRRPNSQRKVRLENRVETEARRKEGLYSDAPIDVANVAADFSSVAARK